ncbi:helix-turn-helix domain-containing protein [Peribacillus deserti]|uniref:AraC family transcriptional regulator n=1 Tax=Peribacillus deserti TaxID=673318 RepID=A0A2N5M4V1_9BACI|nr:AraC family transcriptional regulator [Peribacillus deserti]PLT29396.1 AraC family transcriptional regulator [Peribacillus deserti]
MEKKLYRKLVFPETGVDLYESKHLKGQMVKEHYHDHFQILYALEGEGEITLDGRTYDFSKDRVVLIVPETIHSIKANEKLTVLVLAFSIPVLNPFVYKGILSLIKNHSKHVELDLFTASEIRPLFRKMLYEQKTTDVYSEFAIPIYLMEALLILLRHQGVKKVQDANDVRCIQMREYIDTHYFENITAENLSVLFGISTRYMNDIFKKKYNDTPLQYLQKIRINRAKDLLSETEKDIVSICFEVGYETVSTFYRTFRNLVGISPNKYRTTGQLANDLSLSASNN